MNVLGDDGNLIRRAKQKRPMNAKDGRVVRNVLVLQDVHASIFDVLVSNLRNGRCTGHAADEQQRGENHACFDRNREVGEHG